MFHTQDEMQISMFMRAASNMVLGNKFLLVKFRTLTKFQTRNIFWQVPYSIFI
jgi:hypothetical protein